MSLGWSPENTMANDVKVARTAMDAGVWFHTSQEYGGGGAFAVLRHAFDEDRARVPKIIFKIRCDNATILRFDVEDALRRLGLERVDVAQLCRGRHDHRKVVDDFLEHGPMWETCQALLAEGKVGTYVMEVFASFSPDALKAVENDLFPGYIFYYSPLEREMSNALYDAVAEKRPPLLSLRTLCGGNLNPRRIAELSVDTDHPDIARFAALVPIYEKSGCKSWPEFSFRFLFSIPNMRTTIAGTNKLPHLQELLDAARDIRPLEAGLVEEIKALHREGWNRGE
jgi:aryl-alcohol dehydrogenase-like predicted oxidoreductase